VSCVRVGVRVCVRVCVRACVRSCVRACVRACHTMYPAGGGGAANVVEFDMPSAGRLIPPSCLSFSMPLPTCAVESRLSKLKKQLLHVEAEVAKKAAHNA
jgi:hypothetical protein